MDRVVEGEVVCREAEGLATWLAIWLTVCDTVFFTHERVELSLPATLSVATCADRENRMQNCPFETPFFQQTCCIEQREKCTICTKQH